MEINLRKMQTCLQIYHCIIVQSFLHFIQLFLGDLRTDHTLSWFRKQMKTVS